MARTLSPEKLSSKSKIDQISWLFRPEASHQEHILADVISTLARYAKDSTLLVDNNDDLEILLAVSTVLHRAGKL
jgi:hypothetical protein